MYAQFFLRMMESQAHLETYVGIGERLKEERERLGMNQTDFAAQLNVSKNSQYNYEKGERSLMLCISLRPIRLGLMFFT